MNISRSQEPFYAVYVSYDGPMQARYRELLVDTLVRFTLESPLHPVVSHFFPNSGGSVFLNIEGQLSGFEAFDRCVIVDLKETEKEEAIQELLDVLKMRNIQIFDERFPMHQNVLMSMFIPADINRRIDPVQQWRLCRFIQQAALDKHLQPESALSEGDLAEEERRTIRQERDTVLGTP